MTSLIPFILFPVGIFLLLKGADYLVEGASSLARRFKVPTLVVGLTVVAFGTSMPELFVNISAALERSGGVAFGNIIGSNIANILLILGASALFVNIRVQRSTVWKEIPFSVLAAFVLLVFASVPFLDATDSSLLTRSQGITLLFFFLIFIYYAFEMAFRNKANLDDEKMKIQVYSVSRTLLFILGGLIGLYFGGEWTVGGAIAVAEHFELSQFLISSTIVAVGTSLPELVTSVKAARRGDADLAVGNVVGSNIFNVFWILGVTAVIYPISIPSFAVIDLLFLVFASMLLFAFAFFKGRRELRKGHGIIFLICYILYLSFLVYRG